ncbi:MAG: hypothetical protein QNL62_12755 [Gammaproteobacteria bacterium]|nr:hypothetical protein [Gammaproteobacteria bacterium]
MENIETNIRNVVRALVVRDHKLLLLRKRDEDGNDYFALPGGGQDVWGDIDPGIRYRMQRGNFNFGRN